MSLFLGKIHYWLFNKIKWFESIEQDIIDWAQKEKLPTDIWKNDIYKKYGIPFGDKPLEDIIDNNNIHGWLQDKIGRTEARQAQLITNILNSNSGYIDSLVSIFEVQAVEASASYKEKEIRTPEEIYQLVQDYILEGMPCDRVQEVIVSNSKEYRWKTTKCLHKQYWELSQGDVNNFYTLRHAWIKAFVENISNEFEYVRVSEDTQKIIKK